MTALLNFDTIYLIKSLCHNKDMKIVLLQLIHPDWKSSPQKNPRAKQIQGTNQDSHPPLPFAWNMNSPDFKGEFTHSYAKKTRIGAYDAKDFFPPTKKEN